MDADACSFPSGYPRDAHLKSHSFVELVEAAGCAKKSFWWQAVRA
jgi:hypothetical protein